MDDTLNAELDRLVAHAPAPSGWGDIVRRAGRMRRRRQRARIGLVVSVACIGLVATFAAAGQIFSMLSHSKEPHIVLQGALRADGKRVGTVELELHGAALQFGGRRVELVSWGTQQGPPPNTFRIRWFVTFDGAGDFDVGMLGDAELCHPCRGRDSGRIELSRGDTSALVNDEAAFTLLRHDGAAAVTARLVLDRSHLQRGFRCTGDPARELHCSAIYSGTN